MLNLHTGPLPRLEQYRSPNLGRLVTPRHWPRIRDCLDAGFPTAADCDAFSGWDEQRFAHMVAGLRRAMYGGLPRLTQVGRAFLERTCVNVEQSFRDIGIAAPPLPPPVHDNFLFLVVPDKVKCSCGAPDPCPPGQARDSCQLIGDANGTLERFWGWSWACADLPLAFVVQDGAEKPGMIPWEMLSAVFIGGSTQYKLGPQVERIVREAKRRGLHVHMGRVNSRRRAHYAASIGCDSYDGTSGCKFPDANLARQTAWAGEPHQLRLAA